jgi:hypothetical protein
MKLTNKIKKISEILETPNYFFFKTEDKQIMIYFEGEDKSYQFRGYSMKETIEDAEEYIKENFDTDEKQLKLFEDEDK